MGNRDYSVQESLNLNLGRVGSTLISDTALYEGTYFAVQVVEDAAFERLDDTLRDGNPIASTISFSAGTITYGKITAIKLVSGTVIAYKEA